MRKPRRLGRVPKPRKPIVERVKGMTIGQVQLVDAGDGQALAAFAASYPMAVVSAVKALEGLHGVDIAAILKGEAQ